MPLLLGEVSRRFDVLGILRELDLDEIWAEATDQERRVLVEKLLDAVAIFPDHLEVTVKGAPRLNVTLEGLKGGCWQFVGVGEPKSLNYHPEWRVRPWPPGK